MGEYCSKGTDRSRYSCQTGGQRLFWGVTVRTSQESSAFTASAAGEIPRDFFFLRCRKSSGELISNKCG